MLKAKAVDLFVGCIVLTTASLNIVLLRINADNDTQMLNQNRKGLIDEFTFKMAIIKHGTVSRLLHAHISGSEKVINCLSLINFKFGQYYKIE